MKRILVLLLIFLTMVLSACERDLGVTDQLLLQIDPDAQPEAVGVQEIPDWLKAKIWKDPQTLKKQLTAVGEGHIERKLDLSQQIVNRRKQDGIYRKWINAGGIAVVGSNGVDDVELEKARDIILTMTDKHPKLRQRLGIDTGFYMVLYDQSLILNMFNLPEYYELIHGLRLPTAIGLSRGACRFAKRTKVCIAPTSKVVVVGSRNHGERCSNWWCGMTFYTAYWSTFIHEFAHAMEYAISFQDRDFYKKLKAAYQNARDKNLWTRTSVGYSEDNASEYWATVSEYWFTPRPAHKGQIKDENGRWAQEIVDVPEMSQATLKELDPKLYALLSKWYPKLEIDKRN